MRILVVAMTNSIHTMRWLDQFDGDDEIEILVFPSITSRIIFSKKWKRTPLFFLNFFKFNRGVLNQFPIPKVSTAINLFLEYLFKSKWRLRTLIKVIKKFKPDVIHSLEFQHAGYLCLDAKKEMGGKFPTWIATNWGSDIYLFKNLKAHYDKIKEVLSFSDFYSAECERDYVLADEIGMKAKPLPIIPNAGGLRLNEIERIRLQKNPSQRNIVMIKSYQMTFGRTLNILKSLEDVIDIIREQKYKICFFSVTQDILLSIELFVEKYDLDAEIITTEDPLPHQEILKRYSNARCYVGVSISDGISTSMLEAMAMGAFPIQTCTSCANEWLENEVSGFMPECDDISGIARMIKRALIDDGLVDNAQKINWDKICRKAEYKGVASIAKSFYQIAYSHQLLRKTG